MPDGAAGAGDGVSSSGGSGAGGCAAAGVAAAAGLAGVTPVGWLGLTAGGFRDGTRIAAGDPHLWAAIFEANKEAVLAAADRYSTRMAEFRRALAACDSAALVKWLTEAKQVRDALGS